MSKIMARLGRNLQVVGTTLTIVAVGLLALAPVNVASAAPSAQEAVSERPSITVIGAGEVRSEPDMATVSVGVTHIAPTAQEAMDEVSARMAQVIAAAKNIGVEDRDVKTSGISVQPITPPRQQPGDTPPEIQAYRASNNVTLTIRDLSRASAVLDAVTKAGANVVSGLRFGLSKEDELRRQALAAATADAVAKAQAIALAAGVHITGPLSIVEEGADRPSPKPTALRAEPSADSSPPPVEPGELVVRARVTATYGI